MQFISDIFGISSNLGKDLSHSNEDARTDTFEPPRGKTNNVVSEKVRHKPGCTSTEKS